MSIKYMKNIRRFVTIFVFCLALSVSGYSQNVISEDSLPIEIEYKGVQGVLISYDQLDSTVITGDYLDECVQVRDSLNSRIDYYKGQKAAKDSVIKAQYEELLDYGILVVETEFLAKTYEGKYNTERRRKKLFKFLALVEGVAVAILIVPLLIK